MNINALLNKMTEITASGLPFMEGREKLEVKGDVLNRILTIEDYGFLEGEEGEYVVITFKEYPQHFVYGSSVVTEAMKNFDNNFTIEERSAILDFGFKVRLTEQMSKNKRRYIKITFNPLG